MSVTANRHLRATTGFMATLLLSLPAAATFAFRWHNRP
jgi:hypothetical protein